MMTFDRLNLTLPILQALNSKGYTHPTPIQEKAIPLILDGKDIFGSARTGTGKTAAFALPVMQLMSQANSNSRATRALVLAPTRELAQQISESFHAYGKNLGLRHTVIYGGVSQRPQVDSLRRGTDIIIATPGRLLDLIQQGHVRLNAVEFLILDEADRMLDMGFINDIRKICAMVPTQRQTLLFSATISSEIKKLAGNLLNNPVSIDIKPDIIAGYRHS
jgi:ATP-dependent RNA helicase RhlE